MVIDPVARRTDGESVRIARDVLCAGAPGVKVCLPDGPEETERALARRGSRRVVVVGDDRALLRAVRLLHRERELADAALAVVPVGTESSVALTRGLGLSADVVSAARTALEGVSRRLGLLIDDSGGVVLRGLRIPESPRSPEPPDSPESPGSYGAGFPVGTDGTARTPLARRLRAIRELGGAADRRDGRKSTAPAPPPQRLRVEADGELLADLDRPVTEISVVSGGQGEGRREGEVEGDGGLAEVTVRPAEPDSAPISRRTRVVTVSGPDFRYRADALTGGPVRSRTWQAYAGAWALTLPA